MMDWSWSQWVIIPLIILTSAVVVVSLLGLFLYPLLSGLMPFRKKVNNIQVDAAEKTFKAMDMSWARRGARRGDK